jgi:hypothetical protein
MRLSILLSLCLVLFAATGLAADAPRPALTLLISGGAGGEYKPCPS